MYNPFYSQFLEDNDVEKYAISLANVYEKLARPVLTVNFPEKYEAIIEKYEEEARKYVISNPENLYYDLIILVFKKKS